MDALKKAEIDMEKELWKQIDLCYGAISIALFEEWGWGKRRIDNILERSSRMWDRCAATNEKSMLQMLENETGIEIKNKTDGKSWHDLAYMNIEIDMDPNKMSRAQWIYMRQKQREWVGPQVVACMLLTLHVRYGFGVERCSRLLEQAEVIKDRYKRDPKKVKDACFEIVGVKLKR